MKTNINELKIMLIFLMGMNASVLMDLLSFWAIIPNALLIVIALWITRDYTAIKGDDKK